MNSETFWLADDWELTDKHLKALSQMPFQREWSSMPEKNGLYIVRGPRQVGKTTWMKKVLSVYSKTDRNTCYYKSCENMRDHIDLAEFLKGISQKNVILLDEVTFVKEWSRAIKNFLDSGYEGILVITGSSAADLRRGADRMPGRWGGGGEFMLMPMDIHEFLDVRKKAGWILEDRKEEIELFFRTGGFPGAVAEGGKEGKFVENSLLEFKRWLIGDIVKLGLNQQYLREIMLQIALSHCSTVSLQALAQKTQIGSHHTAQNYIQALEDCFAVRTLYAIDITGKQFFFRKDKKFYFTDPLIFHMAFEWADYRTPANYLSSLAELTIAEILFRKYSRFGYLSTKNGEVDFLVPPDKAIEVKWSPAPESLSGAYKMLQLQNKKVIFQENFLDEI